MKDVSFIIPVYNAELTIRDTVKSILKQKYSGNIEIIAVDDKSNDNSVKILSKFGKYKNFKLIKNKKNIGLAAGLNNAVRKSKYDLVAIIWCDYVLIGENWLNIMVKKINSNKKIACVTSDLILPKKVWESYNFWNKVNTIEEYDRTISNKRFDKLLFYDKKKMIEVGLYDNKTFRIAGEDTDLRLKLMNRGYLIAPGNTKTVHMHGIYISKMSLIDSFVKKALPLAEASGVLFRRHSYLTDKYRNSITYSLVYLFALVPSFFQPVFLILLISILLLYTFRVGKYVKDIRIVFIPFYKFIKDIISLIGFWKGFITGKQEF